MFDRFKDKKILILGFGTEGQSSFDLLRRSFPDKIIGVGDKSDMKQINPEVKKMLLGDRFTKLYLGRDYLRSVRDYDVIIKSPGVSSLLPELIWAKKNRILTSQTEIFFENCRGKIIGITGTKGKSTTTSLIFDILRKAKKKPVLVGNIGIPSLSAINKAGGDNLFVFEMSSHQLDGMEQSPHIAVFLNIYSEHLDYHKFFRGYLGAKKNISKYQGKKDYFVTNEAFLGVLDKKIKSQLFTFNLAGRKSRRGCFIEKGYIVYNNGSRHEKIIKTEESPLPGEFNLQNIMAAVIVAKILEVRTSDIRTAIKRFRPLPHRLEKVGKFRNIIFYNDSIATNPAASVAAIETFGNDVDTIMLGGHERSSDINFGKLAKKIAQSSIRNLILFPTSGKKIWHAMKKYKHSILPFFVDNMKEAVRLSFLYTEKGKICLLSPAAPSFGVFIDYKDRGDQFKEEVHSHGTK